MIASNKALSKCAYSSNNSDSSVVNLLSTDEDDDNEVNSVTSEDDNGLFNMAQVLEHHSIFHREDQKRENNDIMIHRILGPPCGCRRRCREKLDQNIPIVIFSKFWNLPSKFQQNCYLLDCIQVGKPTRSSLRRTQPESRRTITAYYSVDNGNGESVTVCKTEFMSLHGLQNSYSRINGLVKMKKDGKNLPKNDRRGKKERHVNRQNAKQMYSKNG